MRTIIAGSRDITDLRLLEKGIADSGFKITEVVCGGARGVDDLGRKWASNGNRVPVKLFPAKWDKYGKSAGYRRNVEMADYGEALIAIWDGKSRGTKHMIDIATKKGLKIYVYITGGKDDTRKCQVNKRLFCAIYPSSELGDNTSFIPKIRNGKYIDNEYDCSHCLKAGIEHKVMTDIPHGVTGAGSDWGPGIPTTRQECSSCHRWSGPWVSTDIVGYGW